MACTFWTKKPSFFLLYHAGFEVSLGILFLVFRFSFFLFFHYRFFLFINVWQFRIVYTPSYVLHSTPEKSLSAAYLELQVIFCHHLAFFWFYPLMFYRWGSVQVDIQRVQNKKHMINTLPLTSVITCDHCFSLSVISLILCFVTIDQSFYFLLYMAEDLFVWEKELKK